MREAEPELQEEFVSRLVSTGVALHVASELERRILIIETDESQDESRQKLSAFELVLYIGVTLVACVVGLVLAQL